MFRRVQCLGRKRLFKQECKLHAGRIYLQNIHLMMTCLIVMLHNLKPGRVGCFQCPGRKRLFEQEHKLHAGRICLFRLGLEFFILLCLFRLDLKIFILPITGPTIPIQQDLTLNLSITIFSQHLPTTNFQKTWNN